ncbi:MAG TPA: mechanosensitive ion channel family protein, partial [Lysobacter sp.]|nr:mechanosensitive ion channel family protein [Lysobacter sp.]
MTAGIHARCLALLLLGSAALPLAASAQQRAESVVEDAATAARPASALVAQELGRTAREDARIASQVAARLSRQEALANVATEVNGGVVTLSGTVLEETDRDRAESLAASVEGVVAVEQRVDIDASLRERLGPALEQVQDKLVRLVTALPLLLVAAGTVIVFVWLGRWLAKRLHLLRLGSRNPYLDSLFRRGVRLAMLLVGLLVALDLLGATALVGAVLGSAGVLGIMLGFAFRDMAENHLAGVLLSLRRPFEPGDHIVVDGHEGKVVALNSRATILMTLDGNHLRLPNAMVFKGVLLNYTRNPMRRLQFTLGIGTGEDLNAARRLGTSTLQGIPGIASDPEPQATIQSVGESSVLIDFFAWLDQREVDFLKTRSEAIRRVKCAIEDEGMDMPEPIYRVHLTSRDGTGPSAGATPSPRKPRAPEEVQPDLSVNHELDDQVARERAA